LKQRDLRNLNLGDLKKGPKGAKVSPHKKTLRCLVLIFIHSSELSTCYLLYAGFLLGLFFDLEDGSDMFIRNIG
jgi:hypothetical protein